MVRPAWVSPAARPFWILPISFFFQHPHVKEQALKALAVTCPPAPHPRHLHIHRAWVAVRELWEAGGGSGLPSPLSLQLCAVSAVGQGELVSLFFPDPAPVWRHFCRATSILPCAPAEDSLHEFSLIALRQPSSDQLLCLSVGARWLLGNSSRRSRRIPPV